MKKGEIKRVYEQNYLNNGSILLEGLIASCDGRSNPIRNFSAKDLIKATNNFDSDLVVSVSDEPSYTVYKGCIEGRPILVKEYDDEYGSLSNYLYGMEGGSRHDGSLSWKSRIRIAKEIANAVAYLHTAFPRPIIHRCLSPYIVFLDEDGVAKLSGFSDSISIPHGESRVEDNARGTMGFIAPEHFDTGYATEKMDVYSFGVLLLVLLTGQKALDMNQKGAHASILRYVKDYVDKDQFNYIVDPKILGEGGGIEQELQLQAFVELALRCTQYKEADRPSMIDAAKELRRIEKSIVVLPS